ncbi:MAG: hypothetical protein ACPG47_08325 [Leucothrix sp.]
MSLYRYVYASVLWVLAMGIANADTQGFRPFLKTEMFLYSEPVSLDSIRNNWQGRYWQGGQKQMGTLRAEAGVRNGRWSIAGLYREDYYLDFSSDTADLYYGVENDLLIKRSDPYLLSLDAYRFRGVGLSATKQFTFNPRLNGSLGVSVFKASNLLEGRLTGQAQSTSEDEYSFQIQVDNQYAEDPLFERTIDQAPSGIGVALDASLAWQATPKLQLSLKAHDIAGLIRWEGVPYTSAQANSNNVIVDGEGFTKVNPILSGTESEKSHFTQSLKPTAEATMQYALGQSAYLAEAKVKYFEGLTLFGVGLHKRNHVADWGIRYWPTSATVEGLVTHRRFGLSLGIDDIDLKEVRTAWLSLSYSH